MNGGETERYTPLAYEAGPSLVAEKREEERDREWLEKREIKLEKKITSLTSPNFFHLLFPLSPVLFFARSLSLRARARRGTSWCWRHRGNREKRSIAWKTRIATKKRSIAFGLGGFPLSSSCRPPPPNKTKNKKWPRKRSRRPWPCAP